MTRTRGIAVVLGIALLVAIGVACGNGAASNSTGETPSPASQAVLSPNEPTSAPEGSGSAPVTVGAPSVIAGRTQGSTTSGVGPVVAGVPFVQTTNSQAGIWVTGQGSLTLEPDLAVLNVGVETFAKTVSEARGEAARAMDAMINVLNGRGIQGRDIQTRFFNISPQYEFMEVVQDGRRTGKQVLVGYRVNNSAAVKIRDLDAVGSVIDSIADAGGDAVRINGISFTVEEPEVHLTQLREMAVNDALAKADQFAFLTGVARGQLVFITESGGGVPIVNQDFARMVFAEAAFAAPTTPVSGGELELRMSIQAAFTIIQ